jgi:hypothetical protein
MRSGSGARVIDVALSDSGISGNNLEERGFGIAKSAYHKLAGSYS